jgi:amino acid adenylation domain-containing protein
MARVIGFFVNPVVVRGDLSGDPTFSEFLDRFHDRVESTFAHDEIPFSMVVERLQPTRVLSHSPIFQVLFSWQKTTQIVDRQRMESFVLGEREGKRLSMEELHMDPMPLPRRVVPFDLSLLVAESDGELAVTLEYKTDLFQKVTAERILSQFHTLLQGIAADPDCRLSALPLQTERETNRILKEWNPTDTADSPAPCVHEQIEAQAARTPDNVALKCGDRHLTFEELNANANRLAHYLRKNGVGPETIVGLCIDRSPEAIVGILAVLKAGGAYLPLDPGFPPDRLAYLIEDAGVTLVIAQEKHLERLPGEAAPILCMDRDMLVITQESHRNPDVAVFRDNPAYVIYTSGSTGMPKGVPVSHGAIGDHCRDMASYYEYTAADRVLQFASLNFDASIEQIVCPLLAGAQLVLRDDELWAPDEFPGKVLEYGLTVINLPPAYWHQVAEAWAKSTEQVGAHKLRLTIIGGDVLQAETLRLWSEAGLGHVRLLNAYGPTESTITALTFEVPSTFLTNGRVTRIPIGRPLRRRRAYVLDGNDRILPAGVPGELCIGGKLLARGYLGRPGLTAERFVPDPHTDEPGQRMYRTGDVVRYLPDGVVEFFRRADDQVKVRGFRVEPGEIESVLGEHPAVRQIVVLNRQDVPGDNRLVAYVVPREEDPPAASELRSFAKEKLPAFMVPSSFVMLESLPMTPGGKVDRQALPAPTTERVDLENSYVAPRTSVEQELADMWAQVLGVESVGVHDNFFDLGGHSLLATQLVSRVRNAFHVEVPLKDLFDAPTIADIALIIAQDLAGGEDGEEVAKMLSELESLSDDEIQELLSIK